MRELRPFNLEKRKLRVILPMCMNSQRVRMKKREPDFSLVFTDRTRSNRHKFQNRKLHLNPDTILL